MSDPTTPLMQQYQTIKSRYPHALLLFRLGDFYELFYEDALVASRELQITLTARNRERGQPVPMCGVPYHAAETYIARLIRAGYKVAICDQMEQPAPGKKLVRREVVRVITPGTATDLHVLDAKENNFLAALARHPSGAPIGLACVDISTGEFQATEFSGPQAEEPLRDELHLLRPREPLLPRQENLFGAAPTELDGAGGVETRLEGWLFREDYGERMLREQFGVAGLEGFGLEGHGQATAAAGALVHYLRETSGQGEGTAAALRHLSGVRYYEQGDALVLDPVSVRNLELVAPIFPDESARGANTTLVGVLGETCTSMGARLLRGWVLRPEISIEEIEARLEAVAVMKGHTVLREEIRKELQGVLDLERLTSRITLGVAARAKCWRSDNRSRRFRCCGVFLRHPIPEQENAAAAESARGWPSCTAGWMNWRTCASSSSAPSPKSRPRRQASRGLSGAATTPSWMSSATSASTASRLSRRWKSANENARASAR